MARINFNPEQVRPFAGVALLPAGVYDVEVVSETEQDLQGGGRTLVFDFQVLTGEHKGSKIREFFHLWHSNPKAVEVGQSKLVSIMRAVGMTTFMETRELHRKPLSVRVSTVSYNGNDRNQIDDFMPPRNNRPAPQYAQPAPTSYAQPAPANYAQPTPESAPAPTNYAPQSSEPGWF